MKTREELNALKAEVEALNSKLAELTEEELAQVTGGGFDGFEFEVNPKQYAPHFYKLPNKSTVRDMKEEFEKNKHFDAEE